MQAKQIVTTGDQLSYTRRIFIARYPVWDGVHQEKKKGL